MTDQGSATVTCLSQSRPNRLSPSFPVFCPIADFCIDSNIRANLMAGQHRYLHPTTRENTKSLLTHVKSDVLRLGISNIIPRYPVWVMDGVGSEYRCPVAGPVKMLPLPCLSRWGRSRDFKVCIHRHIILPRLIAFPSFQV